MRTIYNIFIKQYILSNQYLYDWNNKFQKLKLLRPFILFIIYLTSIYSFLFSINNYPVSNILSIRNILFSLIVSFILCNCLYDDINIYSCSLHWKKNVLRRLIFQWCICNIWLHTWLYGRQATYKLCTRHNTSKNCYKAKEIRYFGTRELSRN